MDKHTRKDLLGTQMGFNQMRNSIYWLQRYMKKNNHPNEEIDSRLFDMGSNMGDSYYLTKKNDYHSLSDLIKSLYKDIFHSNIEIKKINGNKILVKDSKCALCKYQYDDISVPGCTIETGMISSLLKHYGFSVSDSHVLKSKALGNDGCLHEYELLENTGGSKDE